MEVALLPESSPPIVVNEVPSPSLSSSSSTNLEVINAADHNSADGDEDLDGEAVKSIEVENGMSPLTPTAD